MLAKITQSVQANKHRQDDFPYKVGQWIWLDTDNRRHDFKDDNKGRTAKLMARNDGPFQITAINKIASTVTVRWPSNSRLCPTFHISHTRPYLANDDSKYPSRHRDPPTPPTLMDEETEYIVTHKRRGRGISYLVHFKTQPISTRRWIPGRKIKNISALQDYWRNLRT